MIKSQYGSIEHNGQVLALECQAYADDDPRDVKRTVYCAPAHDGAGNRYEVFWGLKPEIEALPPDERPEEESLYCDWADPERVELIESA